MKTVKRQELSSKGELRGNAQEAVKETAPVAATPKSNSTEPRTRINNAVKAIKSLGGEVTDFSAGNSTDEELQEELQALTEQYKRLKNSKAVKK
jgi:uncharacterized protein with ATP-grasp and redox domains